MGQRVRRYVKRSLIAAILLAGLMWTIDWLVLRYKAQHDLVAYDQIEVHYRYAVHLKNKRIEQRSEKATVECAHSVFPHYGDPPCWYLKRHADQFQELDGSAWHFFYGDE